MNGTEEYNKIKDLVSAPGKDQQMNAATTGPYAYSSLLSEGADSIPGYDDVYGDLMRKEGRVIDTVDRVVNHARLEDIEHASFFKQPLHVIVLRLVKTFKLIFEDAVDFGRTATSRTQKNKNGWWWFNRLASVFMKEDRKIYVGFILVLTAITICVIDTGL